MLQVSDLSKRYGDNVILENVSFIVNAGDRLGMIGPNGCGKTTLLRIIAGKEAADRGSVGFNPPDLRWGYLEQGLQYGENDTLADVLQLHSTAMQALEDEVARLAELLATQAEAWEEYDRALARLEEAVANQPDSHQVEAVLAGLGLDGVALDSPVAILSGGQKTRLGLARILLGGPQLLLLDEPTNHLDLEALEWLESWLSRYRGAVLVVSHDRVFLDRTVNRILDLDPETHRVIEYTGNYSDYIEAWEQRRADQWAQWRDQEDQVRRFRQDIARTKEQSLGVERTTTSGQPGVRRIAKKVAQKAKSREKKLDRYLESDERVDKPALSWQMKLEFAPPVSGQEVMVLEDLAVGYDGVPLVRGVQQILRAGARVALVGPNGAGKTTLLRTIAGRLEPLSGRVRLGANVRLGYYAQEQETLDPTGTPLELIHSVVQMSETDVRSFLHYFLFSGDDVFIPVGSLSYGERARLVLAKLVATGCNFLLLDEPINHLDIPSRVNFERAMAAFEGTVLAVVHDRAFIQEFASQLWSVQGGTVRAYLDLEEMAKQSSRRG